MYQRNKKEANKKKPGRKPFVSKQRIVVQPLPGSAGEQVIRQINDSSESGMIKNKSRVYREIWEAGALLYLSDKWSTVADDPDAFISKLEAEGDIFLDKKALEFAERIVAKVVGVASIAPLMSSPSGEAFIDNSATEEGGDDLSDFDGLFGGGDFDL